jgi:hypothetical protein
MVLAFKSHAEVATWADFTYHITPDTIAIIDTGKGRLSVTADIETVLRQIEYWHQEYIAKFKIIYRDEQAVWDGQNATSFPLRETDETRAILELREAAC